MSELIDRQALLEAMKNRRWVTGRPSDPVCLVEDAPTIDAVPVVHGEWIDMKLGDELMPTICKCSVCGATWAGVGGYIYCPNCGARMDGERREG